MFYVVIFPYIAVIVEDLHFYSSFCRQLFNTYHFFRHCPLNLVPLHPDSVVPDMEPQKDVPVEVESPNGVSREMKPTDGRKEALREQDRIIQGRR